MLIDIAIGDAYGSGFEFVDPKIVEKNNTLERYYAHPTSDLEGGQYTDDTQMSLAIAELLIDESEWTPELIAQKFVDVFKRDPRDGYARGFQALLEEVEDGEEFLEKIKPKSMRNGAAMRSVPLGYIEDIDELLHKAEMQAKVTHDTPIGILSSQAVALLSHYSLRTNPLGYNFINEDGHVKFLKKHIGMEFSSSWIKKVGCDAYETVAGVITVLSHSYSRNEILTNSVALTGDTDSVASIANGIFKYPVWLTAKNDYDLPKFLLKDLENGQYGRNYILALDVMLRLHFIDGGIQQRF
jgi:ADP-ribosylglycohydrolase